MLTLYIFTLVLGGGFLLVSLFGDVLESDAGDLELDLDAGMDVDAAEIDPGSDATHATKILSLRTLTYAMFGFGGVGTALTLWAGHTSMVTLALAIMAGVGTGGVVTAIFNYLKATDTGGHRGDASLVGLSGHVTLPLSERAPGTVVVERGHRRITLRAVPHSSAPPDVEGWSPERWRSVVIVDMEKGVARVAPVEEDLALEP